MYVFDTDVLSTLLRGRLPKAAEQRLHRLDRSMRGTTSITLGELYYGALRTSVPARWLESAERIAKEFTCLDFDLAAARRYGELRAHLERKGTPLDDPDLRIAAICSARGDTLVSGNARHFVRVPNLRFENWLRS